MKDELYQDLREERSSTLSYYLAKSFLWMFFGLAICFGVGYLLAASNLLVDIIVGFPYIYIIAFVIEIVIVIHFSARVNKMSATSAKINFIIFALVNALSFALLFYVYDLVSMMFCFAGASIMFGFMAVLGLTTKYDLSRLRNILLIGLLLIIVSSIFAAIFELIQSNGWIFGSSILGIALFTLLTAFDIQRIKNRFFSGGNVESFAIFGALMLFLDFINIFIYLIRIVGRRK